MTPKRPPDRFKFFGHCHSFKSPPKPPNSNVLRVSVRGWPRRRVMSHVLSLLSKQTSDVSGGTQRRSDATSGRFVPKRTAQKRSGRTNS